MKKLKKINEDEFEEISKAFHKFELFIDYYSIMKDVYCNSFFQKYFECDSINFIAKNDEEYLKAIEYYNFNLEKEYILNYIALIQTIIDIYELQPAKLPYDSKEDMANEFDYVKYVIPIGAHKGESTDLVFIRKKSNEDIHNSLNETNTLIINFKLIKKYFLHSYKEQKNV